MSFQPIKQIFYVISFANFLIYCVYDGDTYVSFVSYILNQVRVDAVTLKMAFLCKCLWVPIMLEWRRMLKVILSESYFVVYRVAKAMKEKISINLHCGFLMLWERLSFNWFLCCRSFSLVNNSDNDNDNQDQKRKIIMFSLSWLLALLA